MPLQYVIACNIGMRIPVHCLLQINHGCGPFGQQTTRIPIHRKKEARNLIMHLSDYFYAAVPSICITIPAAHVMYDITVLQGIDKLAVGITQSSGLPAQWIPDLVFLQGIEKLGIVGILAAGIMFFVMERRSFIAKSGVKLEMLEKRINDIETKITTGNDKVVSILGQQLDALKEIKHGQSENFTRMWQLALRSIATTNDINAPHGFQSGQEVFLRPEDDQEQG